MVKMKPKIVDFNQLASELECWLGTMSLAASTSMPYDEVVDYYVHCNIYGALFKQQTIDIVDEKLDGLGFPTDIKQEIAEKVRKAVDERINEAVKGEFSVGILSLTRLAAFQYLIEDVTFDDEDDGIINEFYLDKDPNYEEGSYNPSRASGTVRDISET